jgi:hypothetical protein
MRDVLLEGWDFKDVLAKDAAIAMFLTAVQRRLIHDNDGCPTFAVSAPSQASGKTALVQLMSHIVFDRPIAATSWTKDDTEMSKHLVAILREGHPCVLFDNLAEGEAIEGNELAKAVTSAAYSSRLLGENRDITLPTQVLWIFTGNNITTTGDFNSRTIKIYLDPKMERPEARIYSRVDLAGWADANRATFFEHAINVLSNGSCVANGGTRFKLWGELVYKPLLASGANQVVDLLRENVIEDSQGEDRQELLALLFTVTAGEPFRLGPLLGRLEAVAGSSVDFSTSPKAELKGLLSHMLPKAATARNLSAILGRIVNRRLGPYWIEKIPHAGNSKSAIQWVVRRTDEERV